MKPEYVYPVDEKKYVYAVCKCPLPYGWGIKMKRELEKNKYEYQCDVCGTKGCVYTRY